MGNIGLISMGAICSCVKWADSATTPKDWGLFIENCARCCNRRITPIPFVELLGEAEKECGYYFIQSKREPDADIGYCVRHPDE